MITVAVKVLKGKEANIEVADTEPVVSFKQLVAREFDVPEQCQRLVFRGKTLADGCSLCDYNIKHGMKIHLFITQGSERGQSAESQDSSQAAHRRNLKRSREDADLSSVDISGASAELSSSSTGSSLWAEMGRFLEQHFSPDDAERVRQAFFEHFEQTVERLSLSELEEYARRCRDL